MWTGLRDFPRNGESREPTLYDRYEHGEMHREREVDRDWAHIGRHRLRAKRAVGKAPGNLDVSIAERGIAVGAVVATNDNV